MMRLLQGALGTSVPVLYASMSECRAPDELLYTPYACCLSKILFPTSCDRLQDPMWLYAEALRDLPKVSDNRDDVYYRLMRPLFDTCAGRYKDSLAPNQSAVLQA